MENEIQLLKLRHDDKARISSINGGQALTSRLRAMGIYPGAVVKKMLSPSRGPVVIEVLNSKVAIGRGMAEKIMVKKI